MCQVNAFENFVLIQLQAGFRADSARAGSANLGWGWVSSGSVAFAVFFAEGAPKKPIVKAFRVTAARYYA
jgi:hypothetical protein